MMAFLSSSLAHPSSIWSSHFLLDEANIDGNAVHLLRKNRLVAMRDFSHVEQELPQVSPMLEEMFGIKEDSDMETKLQLSRAVGGLASFEEASLRAAHRLCCCQGSRREQLARSSYLSLLQAFQKEQGDDRMEDEELPFRGIVEDILEQLEEGELHTEQLSEVVAREQEDKSLRKSSTESELTLRVDGSWRRKPRRIFLSRFPRRRPSVATRYAILANAWEFVRLKNPVKKGAARPQAGDLGEALEVVPLPRRLRARPGAPQHPLHRAIEYRCEMGHGFIDVFFLFNCCVCCCRCLWLHSERRDPQRHRRDQQEIGQAPVCPT